MSNWVGAELAQCQRRDVRHTKRLARLLELLWERKDAMEIRHGQELGLAVCDLLRLGQGLTLGAVAIAACVIGIALKAALGTLFGVSPECSGTTDEDRDASSRRLDGAPIRQR